MKDNRLTVEERQTVRRYLDLAASILPEGRKGLRKMPSRCNGTIVAAWKGGCGVTVHLGNRAEGELTDIRNAPTRGTWRQLKLAFSLIKYDLGINCPAKAKDITARAGEWPWMRLRGRIVASEDAATLAQVTKRMKKEEARLVAEDDVYTPYSSLYCRMLTYELAPSVHFHIMTVPDAQ